MLHYTELGTQAPAEIRSFLIDAGGSYGGYASDITRTYAHDTAGEFQALIDAVDAAQLAMCDQVRAGTDYKRIHLDAHLALAGILKDFGISKLSPEAALETGVSNVFFPHGIGHGIGLQVHDVAGFAESDRGGTIAKPEGHPYLRTTRVLEPGMVVTIEPGIYFVDLLLDGLRKRRACQRRRLVARRCVPAVRRHPHRGRRGVHRWRAAQPDPRRLRRGRVSA